MRFASYRGLSECIYELIVNKAKAMQRWKYCKNVVTRIKVHKNKSNEQGSNGMMKFVVGLRRLQNSCFNTSMFVT